MEGLISRIANQFGFSKEDLHTNLNIGFDFYKVAFNKRVHGLTA